MSSDPEERKHERYTLMFGIFVFFVICVVVFVGVMLWIIIEGAM